MIWPGRRGGCPPRLPQIRTCPMRASGSSGHGLIRCCFVNTLPEFDASDMFPSNDATTRRSLPSTGSVRNTFPRFPGTMKRSDARSPSRLASLPSRGGTREVRPRSSLPSARRRRRAWSFVAGCPLPDWFHGREPGTPRFLENPPGLLPCSPTPAGTVTPRPVGAPSRTPPV
jgi:hypothetical protein